MKASSSAAATRNKDTSRCEECGRKLICLACTGVFAVPTPSVQKPLRPDSHGIEQDTQDEDAMSSVSQAWSVVDPMLKNQQAQAKAVVNTATEAENHIRSAGERAIMKGRAAARTSHSSTCSSSPSTASDPATPAPTKTRTEPATARQIRYMWVLCKTLGIARTETEQIVVATKNDIDAMSRTLTIMEYDCEHMDELNTNTCGWHGKYLLNTNIGDCR